MEKSYQTFINADFQEVEATLYEYKEFEKNGLLYYAMFYKYEAPNGDEFTGFWQNDINSKEDAEAAIGSSPRKRSIVCQFSHAIYYFCNKR